MKTLMFLATHFIDANVISEYRKMGNAPNVDAVLAIDNTNLKLDFINRIENRNFFDTSVKCFFFDSKLHDELELPYFAFGDIVDFGKNMWHNGDYRFYYFRKNFPNYDYYWMIDYDVFCNAETYEGFLKKFAENHSDLLVQNFRAEKKNGDWYWSHGIDWIYKNNGVYGSLYPVVRLSARAIDFLYKRRLEHKKIFEESNDKNKKWLNVELFTATELMNGGFSCENLNESRLEFLPHIYLNDERIFLNPDNHLYHPVKSVKSEIDKMKNMYAELFFYFRKNFLIQLYEKLTAISTINLKDLPVHFDENFHSMVIDLTGTGGNLRLEINFWSNSLYGAICKISSAVVFEGEYFERFKIIEQQINFNNSPFVKVLENSTCKMLSYSTTTFDNVSQVANITNILIEMTFTILQEKFYENNRQ